MQQDDSTFNGPYQIFVIVLSLFALGMLVLQISFVKNAETLVIINYTDNGICLLFFADFIFQLYKAKNRAKYFFTWGWLDLLSCIPMIDAFRAARVARVIRIARLFRAFKATRILLVCVVEKRMESTFLLVGLMTIIIIFFGSVAILHVEDSELSNIKTGDDAIWWAMTTVSTVGYGDRYPVTTEGRVVAVFLMFSGVGIFGVFAALITTYILRPNEDEQSKTIGELKNELALIRKLVEENKRQDV